MESLRDNAFGSLLVQTGWFNLKSMQLGCLESAAFSEHVFFHIGFEVENRNVDP